MHFSNLRRQNICLDSGYLRIFLSITRKISIITWIRPRSHIFQSCLTHLLQREQRGLVTDCNRASAAALPRLSITCYWNWWLYVVHKHGDLHYTIYNTQYTIYNIQYIIYNTQYTIYNIHYTVYNIQYAIYKVSDRAEKICCTCDVFEKKHEISYLLEKS